MANVLVRESSLTAIADAIRSKTGGTDTYTPAEMADAIEDLSVGGITPTGTLSVTANGTYDVTEYASADVAIDGDSATLGTKSITANGTYTAADDSLDGYSSITVNVESTELTPLAVDFVDYDGTLLYTYSASDFAALTALPSNPSHDGLTAQGWNWTLSDAQTHVATYGALVIGQNYTTDDGTTRIYLSLTEDMAAYAVSVCFVATVKNGVTVAWGDGDTSTSTANAGAQSTLTHTYSAAGDYVITLTVTDGDMYLGYNGSNLSLINCETTALNKPMRACVTAIELGDSVTMVYRQCFSGFNSLESVSIPTTLATLSASPSNYGEIFQDCRKLTGLVIPNTVTILPIKMCYNCAKLKYCAIPYEIVTVYNTPFYQCFDLKKITFSNVETMGDSSYVCQACYGLDYITLGGTYTTLYSGGFRYLGGMIKNAIIVPSTVTTINTYVFSETFVPEFHILAETPPTLSGTNAFHTFAGMKIYVPYSSDSSVLAAYQAASNWSSLSSYLVEESA